MIRIIGKDQGAVKVITCRNCATVLEYTPSDEGGKRTNFDYLGDSDVVKYIVCPNCGHHVHTK